MRKKRREREGERERERANIAKREVVLCVKEERLIGKYAKVCCCWRSCVAYYLGVARRASVAATANSMCAECL